MVLLVITKFCNVCFGVTIKYCVSQSFVKIYAAYTESTLECSLKAQKMEAVKDLGVELDVLVLIWKVFLLC